MAALLAGLPQSVAGVTVNRLCASGLAAIVGGLPRGDRRRRRPLRGRRRRVDEPRAARDRQARPRRSRAATARSTTRRSAGASRTRAMEAMFPLESMGETGENVAERYGVSREEQDAFALRSQQRWAEAQAAGRFADELVAGRRRRGRRASPARHDGGGARASCGRRSAPGGTVTAGNSSGINDGAAARRDRERGARAGARRRAARRASRGSAVAGVDPRVMGIGPIPAVRKLLARTGVDGRASSTSSS